MAIEFVGYAALGITSLGGVTYNLNVSTLTGGISSSIAPGDLIVVATGMSATADTNPGVTSPTMTETLDLYSNDTVDSNMSISWMIAGSTPPSTITLNGMLGSTFGNGVVVTVWRGIDQTTPFDVLSSWTTGINTGDANPPAITPATGGVTILAIGLSGVPTSGTFTGPSGFTDVATAASSGSTSGVTIKVAYLANQPAGVAVDPGVMTHSPSGGTGASWGAVTLALRPGSTAATATLGSTEASDTASFAMSARHTAALGATEAADTASFSVSARHTAVLDTGEVPDTVSIALVAETEVYLNATEDADAASFGLVATNTSTLTATDPPDVVAIAATIVGLSQISLASTEAADTAAVAVSLTPIATVAIGATEARDTAAVAATLLNALTASLAVTEARDVAAVATSLAGLSTASLAATEARDTAVFTASRFDVLTSNLAVTEASDIASITTLDPLQIAAAGYAAKRRRKAAAMPQPPKPPRVEVVIDEAVLRQIEEERLAALDLERKRQALQRVEELRQGYRPTAARTVKLEVKAAPAEVKVSPRTVTLARPPKPTPQQAPIRGSIALSVIRPALPVEVRQPVYVSLRRAANRQAHSG